ncbi:MAG: outer membrane beta-barrel protein [Bacteroidales bacterium]|nr:outer membrane beta-barrel protein [Bacteroidales bacterium]
MKKLIVLIFALCLLNCPTLYSQNRVRAIEGGLFVGLGSGTNKCGYKSMAVGVGLGAELRYNFQNLPIDLGIQYSLSMVNRKYEKTLYYDPDPTTRSKSSNLLLIGDYNFNRGNKVSVFVGLGTGLAKFEDSAPAEESALGRVFIGDRRYSFCFMPRVGVEFFNRLRLSVEYKIEEKANSNIAFNIGFAFGGGKIKD